VEHLRRALECDHDGLAEAMHSVGDASTAVLAAAA
jgi:hypothetical protein